MDDVSKQKEKTRVVSESKAQKAEFMSQQGWGASEGFLNVVSDVDEYAIILLDKDGFIRTWNKGAERIKGYSPDEIIGKHFRLFYSRENKEANFPETLLETAVQQGKVNLEGWRIRKDGTRFWGSVTITPVRDTNGEVTGFLKMTRDLTDRRIAEDSLSKYAEEIKIKNDELRRSEERYHKMVAEIRDYAIILLDAEGKILEWNKGAELVKGYESSEIVGKSFRLLYTPEDRERKLPEKLLNEARTLGSTTHEGWRVRKNGTRFWGYVSITALHDEKGEVFGFSKITRDFSERKAAEEKLSNYVEELRQKNEQLRRSEDRYYRMIEEVQDYAIIFLSVNGEIQNWNSGAQKIKGYSSTEVIGKRFSIFYTPEDRAMGLPEQLLSEAAQHGKSIHEGWRLRKDGSRFWASVVITALHDQDNHIIGFSKVTRDLTERRQAEEAMDMKNKALEQANAQLSSFAFVASHDLKEPLRKIQVFTSRIVDSEHLSEKSNEYVGKIVQSARRMQALIEDLLAFSKLSAPGEREVVNLNNVVAGVQSDLEVAITDKHATILAEPLPTISGTAFQLHQLFLNLFSNSLKFAKEGRNPVISIGYELVSGPVPGHGVLPMVPYHRIRISDNGIGFSQDQASRIFDVFYRLHSRDSFEGAGIGLAIVKRVVDNHKGIIATEGKPDEGASFYIYFPKTDA